MFFRKIQWLTQTLGILCLFGLAGYGLFMVLSHDSIAWAMPTGAASSAPPASVELIPSSQTAPTVPALLNYQGELKDNNGNPLSGAYNMTFRIYDSVSAGTALWTEQQNNVTVRNGVFSVLLGGTTAIPVALFHAPDRFIGVTVAPYAEMAPRQRLSSVPYAIWSNEAYYSVYAGTATSAGSATNATNADTLDGLDSTVFSRADHNHNWNSLAGIPAGFADGIDNEGITGNMTIQTQTVQGSASCPNPVYTAAWDGTVDYQLRLCIGSTCSNWMAYACRVYDPNSGGGGGG